MSLFVLLSKTLKLSLTLSIFFSVVKRLFVNKFLCTNVDWTEVDVVKMGNKVVVSDCTVVVVVDNTLFDSDGVNGKKLEVSCVDDGLVGVEIVFACEDSISKTPDVRVATFIDGVEVVKDGKDWVVGWK